MPFGDTAKKVQRVANMAEDLYEKMNQLRGQIQSLREEVETTSEQVDEIERDLAEQRALLEAIAENEGVDVETVIADAHIDAVESGDAVAEEADRQGTEDVKTERESAAGEP